MISSCEHLKSESFEFFEMRRDRSFSLSQVLRIGDHEIRRVLAAQLGSIPRYESPSFLSEYIAESENFH
ncbi:MAG TPA: hypothetical protein PK765_06170 [bacterium]|nr:hypothetical protein [bacterium]